MRFSYDHNQSLGYLAGLASRLLSNTLVKRFQEAGIDMTAEQWGAIIVLLNNGAMTQGHLGQRLFLEKSSMSRLANGLERHGWVVRAKDPEDSRQKLVVPTAKARDTAERCASIARSVLEEAQHGLSQEARLSCRSFLGNVIENLDKSAT